MKRIITLSLVLALFGLTATANAQAPQRPQAPVATPGGQKAGEADFKKEQDIASSLDDKVKVVKHKYFLKGGRFEATPVFGMSINDPFKTRYPVGAHLVYHIGENFGIGLTGLYNLNMKSSDVTIIRKSGAAPDVTDLMYNAHLDFYFSPIYGKMAIMSNIVLNFDIFIAGGVGVMGADIPDETGMAALSTNPLDSASGMVVAGNVGLGGRLFLTKWLALSLEVRDYIYSMRLTNVSDGNISDIQNLVVPFIGVSFYMPFNFEYSE